MDQPVDTASKTRSEAQGEAQSAVVSCDGCQRPFTPTRHWSRFCSSKCRMDYHRAMDPKAVREARDLVRMALDAGAGDVSWQARARKVLGIK